MKCNMIPFLRYSIQSSDSGLSLAGIKDSKTPSLEQVDQHLSAVFADMRKSIVDPLIAQIRMLEQQLLDSQERETALRQREEDLRKSTNEAIKQKEDVERHLAQYVCTIGKLETECKEMKAQILAYEKQRRTDDMLCSDSEYRSRAPLCSQLSISSLCSDSSMGTQEGIYYTSHSRCMCTTANMTTYNYPHSVRIELSESATLPRKKRSFKKVHRCTHICKSCHTAHEYSVQKLLGYLLIQGACAHLCLLGRRVDEKATAT